MSRAHTDVSFLCMQLLMQFRELFANSPSEASLRYGISLQDGELLKNMSAAEMQQLAESGKMAFSLAIDRRRLQASSALSAATRA